MGNGAAHGELYGPGIYFAESVSKADTYAKPRADGLCGMIINRVLLGNIFVTTERNPSISQLMRKIHSRDYETICGDRTSIQGHFGGWKEFIVYEECQSMPLYLVWYKRDA